MAKSRELIYVLSPSAPGDLSASRSVLATLAKTKTLKIFVEKKVAPLLAGLSCECTIYELNETFNVHHSEFKRTLNDLRIPNDAHVLDLIGTLPVLEWLSDRGGPSSGYDFDKTINFPYVNIAEWALMTRSTADRSHYSVRLLRIIPDYSENTIWPNSFELPCFGNYSPASAHLIALMPGSSKGGLSKRMPVDFWKALSFYLRNEGFTLIWFLGPDEESLVGELVCKDDVCTFGMEWPEIITSHASCLYGFSNDTCHVHIRVHIPRSTFVFFRRDDGPEWGSYPEYVDYIEAPITFDMRASLSEASSWLKMKIKESICVQSKS